jgi:hypothetical protein
LFINTNKKMPEFSQGFVLMLGLLVLIALVYVIGLIVGSIWINGYRKTTTAVAYTFDNDNFCDCTNGGECQLVVDYNLVVPPYPVDASIPHWSMIHFAANLVAAIEAPWAYKTENKNAIPLPVTVIRDAELWAEGNIIGIVAHQNDTAFVFYKGTTTKEEWTKNFEFKETAFSAASDPSASRAMQLGCGCGGNNRGGRGRSVPTTNTKIKKQHDNHAQRAFLSSGQSLSKRADDGFEVSGRVHGGWLELYNEFNDKLISTLENLPSNVNKLVISGHSLGAALATITLADNNVPTRYHANTVCYAIASPRVGDGAFTLSLGVAGRVLFRLINLSDIVNDIPTAVMPNHDNPKRPYLYSQAGEPLHFQTQRESLVQNHLLPTYIQYIKSQL